MSTPEETITALARFGFRAEDKRPEREYIIASCNVCKKRWSVGIRNGQCHYGNILALLDHSASHEGKHV